MKKSVVIAVAIISFGCMKCAASSVAQCLLQHKGQVSFYDASQIATAVKNAADGDTLFLTEGTFNSFTIEKAITVRGAGQKTILSGSIEVKIPNTPTLTQPLLEGLYVSGGLSVSSSLNNLTVRQCLFTSTVTFNANINDANFDRCDITTLDVNKYAKSLRVMNTNIVYLDQTSYSDLNDITLVNCDISSWGKTSSSDTYIRYITLINSIIKDCASYNSYYNYYCYASHCSFINCLLCQGFKISGVSVQQDCYVGPSSSNLEENGYLGIDGTVVGKYGGASPYSLTLNVPKVTEKTLSYDAESKVLNVSLKVSAK